MAAEKGFEVKVIFLAMQPVSNDAPQSGLMCVSEVRQCRWGGAEVGGSTGQWNENVLTYFLADELVRGQQGWNVGVAVAEQKLNLAMYQHLLTDSHAV